MRGKRGETRRRAVAVNCQLPTANSSSGWTLIELVITMTVLAILSVGVLPMVKTAVKRQHEYQLRESLRTMREAIKEFKRDTVGIQCAGAGGLGGGGGITPAPNPAPNPQPGQGPAVDPRSKVVIGDCTIFSPENIMQYPPNLDTLVSGVNVVSRLQPIGGLGQGGELPKLGEGGGALANKKKIYLREIPKDPMTGEATWCLHSPFDDPGSCAESTDAGIFDVTSKSDGTALDGTKYKDW
jgi:general secretion pathway protein G